LNTLDLSRSSSVISKVSKAKQYDFHHVPGTSLCII
jgi:hypothetical protein